MDDINAYIPSILESLFLPLDYSYILNYHWCVNGWCFNQLMGTLQLLWQELDLPRDPLEVLRCWSWKLCKVKKLKWSKEVSEISKIKQNPIGWNFVHAIWAFSFEICWCIPSVVSHATKNLTGAQPHRRGVSKASLGVRCRVKKTKMFFFFWFSKGRLGPSYTHWGTSRMRRWDLSPELTTLRWAKN